MGRVRLWIAVGVVFAIFVGGCGRKAPQPAWSVEPVRVVEGFDAPECALCDPERDVVYVSNIETSEKGYWLADGEGFISVVNPDGVVRELRAIDGTEESPLDAPKGMALLDGYLYFNDLSVLKRYDLDDPNAVEAIELDGAMKLNDIASDGEAIWVSDVEASRIYRVDGDLKVTEIHAPENVNGVTCYDGKIFAVSWYHHDLYELDPTGVNQPVPFGLAEHFTNLDGIEVLDDGTFIVSDFTGNRICTVGPDRKTVRTLVEMETPADIGLDRERGLLYVPQLAINKLVIFRLTKQEQ
jgi:hypothetical protein